MVASKYAKVSTLINITQQKKERKEEKTTSYANVSLSADINSCSMNCTFSKIYLYEGQ